MSDLFCRHNRFTADCPICAKGTLLDPHAGSGASRPRRSSSPGATAARAKKQAARGFRGPYASAGPYDREDGTVEVRLEKVPGGVRLAEWASGTMRQHAPVLAPADVRELVAQARERAVLPERDLAKLEAAVAVAGEAGAPTGAGEGKAPWGTSRGRSADLKDELRVEPLEDGTIRVARWILRPGAGWELQDAPPMLPAVRFAEALADAVRAGIV